MGASSGPSTMALFNSKPFLIVNTDANPELYHDLIKEDQFLRFSFSSPFQRFLIGEETFDILIKEFARMWETVNKDEYLNSLKNKDASDNDTFNWLR